MNQQNLTYQYWLEKLGMATPELLCLISRGVSRKQLPGGRDRPLERYLSDGVRDGLLSKLALDHQRVYQTMNTRQGSSRSLYHDLMAAQSAVKLWLAFKQFPRWLYNPSDFFTHSLQLIPDFGLVVALENGTHAFALEYQTYKEASRTTSSKIAEYWQHFEALRKGMSADSLWVVFVLERDEIWVSDFARSLLHSFVYLVPATTFLHTEAITTEKIFLTEGGTTISLVESL